VGRTLQRLKQLLSPQKPIPLLILLGGSLLMFIGFYTATSRETTTSMEFRGTMSECPLLLQGVLIILGGIVITVLGYLLYHGEKKQLNLRVCFGTYRKSKISSLTYTYKGDYRCLNSFGWWFRLMF
jgi:hypothetical protein